MVDRGPDYGTRPYDDPHAAPSIQQGGARLDLAGVNAQADIVAPSEIMVAGKGFLGDPPAKLLDRNQVGERSVTITNRGDTRQRIGVDSTVTENIRGPIGALLLPGESIVVTSVTELWGTPGRYGIVVHTEHERVDPIPLAPRKQWRGDLRTPFGGDVNAPVFTANYTTPYTTLLYDLGEFPYVRIQFVAFDVITKLSLGWSWFQTGAAGAGLTQAEAFMVFPRVGVGGLTDLDVTVPTRGRFLRVILETNVPGTYSGELFITPTDEPNESRRASLPPAGSNGSYLLFQDDTAIGGGAQSIQSFSYWYEGAAKLSVRVGGAAVWSAFVRRVDLAGAGVTVYRFNQLTHPTGEVLADLYLVGSCYQIQVFNGDAGAHNFAWFVVPLLGPS